jgi:AAA-like domain
MSLKASEYGNRKVQEARQSKGWTIENPQPLLAASKVLEPNNHWIGESSFYAVSQATWRRFTEGKAVRSENFKAFCQILDLEWRDICRGEELFDLRREPQESRCERTILQPASLLRIKGPQNMGKTRMLNRVLKQTRSILNENSHNLTRIVTVNFPRNFDLTVYDSLDRFLRSLCQTIAYQLTKSNRSAQVSLVDSFQQDWERLSGTPNHKASVYFENQLLDLPLVLILEDIDRVFAAPFAIDFCDLIRGWHTEAQRDDLWQNLSLAIIHSTDVYASMDIGSSPLANLGEIVILEEFSPKDVESLVKQYNLDWDRGSTAKIMALVGGNPDLIDLALKTMVDELITLDQILLTATSEAGIYRDRLRKLWSVISLKPRLKAALQDVTNSVHANRIDPLILHQLESLGLIKIEADRAAFRCELYRQYFTRLLTMENNL